MNRIFNFDLDGKTVLGFDTGLDAQAFAQAKMAQFITQRGFLVYPDGRAEPWNASSVIEKETGGGEKTMIVWGPCFHGETLDTLLRNTERKDEALAAIRRWIKARLETGSSLADEDVSPYPGAAGVMVGSSPKGQQALKEYPEGTMLFLPERLVKRCIEADGDTSIETAQQWIHPDLEGAEAVVFSAAAMLYAVFCGEVPFKINQEPGGGGLSSLETLRQDIREGVYLPPELASPGLNKDLARLISEGLGGPKQKTEGKKRPSLQAIADFIDRGPSGVSSWSGSLSEEEQKKILDDRDQYLKTKNLTVKTRRFVIRNTSIIMACTAAVLALILGIWGYIKHQAELPNTKGMNPIQVAETFYGAFETMDHTTMEACVINKAGKNDINMVTNLYVISKMRMAYESIPESTLTAREWLDAGSPLTDITVFGVTDLKLKALGEREGEVSLEAAYTLWVPPGFMGDENENPSLNEAEIEVRPPTPVTIMDKLKLVLYKDAWRIAEIDRVGF
jgi:hypothetical protein